MNEDILLQLSTLMYSMIVSSTPVDTRNLLNHTTYEYDGNKATIVISAPKVTKKGAYNYAHDVNYNRQRGRKEVKNYHYVEKAIIQAAEIVADRFGGIVINEL